MGNTIGLAAKYIPLLDEVYKASAKTSVLDASPDLVREGMTANSIYIPNITMQGLGDYDTATGFVDGDVTFAWKQHTFTQDRGRSFSIDAVENMETIDMAFGAVAGQFIRTHVVPEVDAYRFAKLATNAVTNSMNATATLAATTAMEAIDTGLEKLADQEVDTMGCVIYVSPAIYTYLKQTDQLTRTQMTNVGNAVVDREIETLDGRPLMIVPQTRFYSVIEQLSGGVNEEAGGFAKAALGKNINFLIVDPQATFGITKTALPRIFSPEENQKAHAWKFDYRLYHDLFVQEAKKKGMYVHTVA